MLYAIGNTEHSRRGSGSTLSLIILFHLFFLFLFILFALFNWIHWIRTLDMFNEIGVLLFFFNSFILYRLFTNIGVKIEMKFFFYAFYIKSI